MAPATGDLPVTARTKATSARTATAALWDSGDTRTDEDLAAALGVTAYTVRCYHQQWNRRNGKRNGRALSLETEVEILAMRSSGMSYPDIVEVLKEDYDRVVSPELARQYCLREVDGGLPVAVDVDADDLPLMTTVGLCWAVRFQPPSRSNAKRHKDKDFCDFCPHLAQCYEAGWDSQFVRCERPLQFEIMEVKR